MRSDRPKKKTIWEPDEEQRMTEGPAIWSIDSKRIALIRGVSGLGDDDRISLRMVHSIRLACRSLQSVQGLTDEAWTVVSQSDLPIFGSHPQVSNQSIEK